MESRSRQASSPVDPALIAKVAKGDQQAFGQLYDLSCSLLFTLSLRILGDRDEAADLLQEVYLEVWRKGVRYDVGRGTPTAWLVTVTRSRAIDRLRSRAAKSVRSPRPEVRSFELQTSNVELRTEDQADQEIRTAVAKALAELPDGQQQALELAYYEGLSHQEIAARLNQPLGTIKTRIKLGMDSLKTLNAE
ncbi:MAG: sigma-70 family RNA polymerase sigma factor [Nitrospirae bacterium]|nr:sigma-70 family RNA polymerase sigma factor [Nitrospirota bacterium]